MSAPDDDRGEMLLGMICDEIDQRMNPDDEECPECGGEGYTFDCFDGCCVDADSGCDDCGRRCIACARHKHTRLKAVRMEVIKSGDVDIARAWLKEIGRWKPEITDDQIRAELAAAAGRAE